MPETASNYIAQADKLAADRRDTGDEAARTELARREFDLLAKAAETERDMGKLLALRLRMSKLPGIDPPKRIDMMNRAGACAARVGDPDQGLSLVESALEMALNHGDVNGRFNSLFELGVQWRMRGDLARSEALLREGKDLGTELGDKSMQARAGMALSNTLRHSLKIDEAADEIHSAIRTFRNLGDLAGATRAMMAVAHLEGARGRHDEERAVLEEAVQLAELANEPGTRARALGNLGLTLVELGEHEEAFRRLNEATDLFKKLGLTRDAIRGLLSASTALDASGQSAQALEMAERGESLAREHGCEGELAEALSHQAAYCVALDRPDDAEARALESAGLLDRNVQPLVHFTNAETLGRVSLTRQDFEGALEHFVRAEQFAETANYTEPQARMLRLQAECLDAMDDPDGAREAAVRSIELLDANEQGKTVEYLQAIAISASIEQHSGNVEEARFLAEDAQALRKELNLRQPLTQELRRAIDLLDQLAPQ